MGNEGIAVFDFDGTITRGDTLFPFLHFICAPGLFWSRLARLIPTLVAFRVGTLNNEAAKERVLCRFLEGIPLRDADRAAKEFALRRIPAMVRPAALRRIEWHKRAGHRLILVSASCEIYLRPWAEQVGFSDVVASRLEADGDGLLTGRLVGGNCYGPEKAKRLVALLGERNDRPLYCYGDSRGDREMLALARYPFFRVMPAAE